MYAIPNVISITNTIFYNNSCCSQYTKREVQELLRYEKANFLSESSPIRIVNVISGTPLVSEQDPTGGFGDIASNLFAARELKKRNPKLEINFIITTQNLSDDDIKYGVRRTDDIMKILVPSLDIHMYDKPQQIEGINFILLPQDAEAMSYKEYLNQHKSFGRTIIPSDLSIQFSANEFSKVAVLNSNSKVAFSQQH
ncbi:MAG: hypothetical protein L6Q37_07825 [Bdellovibrionaceae bacterium]|nr:hypothetical protein [Pseudobdellovibrionaceae bacterium]NUM59774.1 hypothetical protein [Pseudobdellovibrionaceae bacterium]